VLGIEYLQRTDLAHIVDESMQGKTTHVPAQQSRSEVRPGNGAPKAAAVAAVAEPKSRLMKAATPAGANPDAMHGSLSGDAPLCGTCGFITIRNGTCFRCMNCGNSMGCS
jgi:ribonucleoside-diphosphate reductase alpha chain